MKFFSFSWAAVLGSVFVVFFFSTLCYIAPVASYWCVFPRRFFFFVSNSNLDAMCIVCEKRMVSVSYQPYVAMHIGGEWKKWSGISVIVDDGVVVFVIVIVITAAEPESVRMRGIENRVENNEKKRNTYVTENPKPKDNCIAAQIRRAMMLTSKENGTSAWLAKPTDKPPRTQNSNGQAYQNGLFYPYLAVSFCYFRLFNINAVVLDAFDVASYKRWS